MQPAASKPLAVIVEDSILNQMILEQRLRPSFELKMAANVSSGIALLDLCASSATTPHLVLSDYALPDGDGFAVLEHAQLRFPNVPRVLMSSSAPSGVDLKLGVRGLVTLFLRKPIRLQELLSL